MFTILVIDFAAEIRSWWHMRLILGGYLLKRHTTLLLLAAAIAPGLTAGRLIDSNTGLANPAFTVTFAEVSLAPDTPLTNQFVAQGLTFSNLYFNNDYTFGLSIAAPGAANFDANLDIYNPYSIYFSTPQTEVAFGLVTNVGDVTTITARLGGNDIDSFSFSTNFTGHFFGFTGLSGFDEILFSTAGSGGGNAILDTIQIGTPEPSSAATGTLGLAILLLLVSRRRLLI